jgi:hypothetical protein
MSRNGQDSASILQEEIRKQFGSPATARFARSLAPFQVDRSMPDRFAGLLAELDRAEADQRNAGMNGDSH